MVRITYVVDGMRQCVIPLREQDVIYPEERPQA